MKILISTLTIAALMFSSVVFVSADAPLRESRAVMTVVCPHSVVTAIINPPPDWKPVSVLTGAELPFQHIFVQKEFGKPIVVCAYTNQKGAFAVHTLRRVFPANYVCSVTKGKEGDDFSARSATCAPRIKLN